MNGLETRLFCRLDGLSAAAREQQRLFTVAELGLLEADSIPVFEEASQTAAQFLGAPVCWMSVLDRDTLWLKASIGLSKLGLMNSLAKTRRMAREDSFDTHVVDSQQVLALSDAAMHPAFSQSALVQQFGIRAYLGAPLVVSGGHCLGTLAILYSEPKEFTEKDVQSLELVARWCVSEFERDQAIANNTAAISPASPQALSSSDLPLRSSSSNSSISLQGQRSTPITSTSSQQDDPSPLRLKLVGQLTQQLRAPLTAVLGMAGMLSREIYGPLTDKQREYLEVIQRSGQTLLSLIQEIMDLAALENDQNGLNLTPVDIELLSQKVLHSLTPMGNQQDLQLQCSVEPGKRVWRLDKDKLRQMLYHLVFSIIQSANGGSVIKLHISRKTDQLQLSLWVSHPWLGEGLPPNNEGENLAVLPVSTNELSSSLGEVDSGGVATVQRLLGELAKPLNSENLNELLQATSAERPENLRLLLSRHLAEIQGGQLFVQSSSESGYRYIALLPISNFTEDNNSL